MSINIKVNDIASRKISLHSLKYLTEDVFGVVVGVINGNDVQVSDAYPLFHSKFLSPTLETAFEFVEKLTTAKNQTIIGWYEGHVKNNDNDTDAFTEISKEVVENMSKNTKFPLLLSVKEIVNEDMEASNTLEIRGFLGKRGAIDYDFQRIITTETKLDKESLKKDLDNEFHLKIIDFQSHLTNFELDFRNEFIN